MALGDMIRKAKGFARQNPDKAKKVIDKIESTVDEKTQGKYRDQVSKASNAVGGALGVERDDRAGQAQDKQDQPSGQEVPGAGQRENGQTSASGQEVPSQEQRAAHRSQASVSGQEVPGQDQTRSDQDSVSGQEVPGKNRQHGDDQTGQ